MTPAVFLGMTASTVLLVLGPERRFTDALVMTRSPGEKAPDADAGVRVGVLALETTRR